MVADNVTDDNQYNFDYSLEDFALDVGVGMVGNEAFFAHEPGPLDDTKESVSAVIIRN